MNSYGVTTFKSLETTLANMFAEAPLTSFTAEEIWKYMPKTENENVESVMLTDYPSINAQYENEEDRKQRGASNDRLRN